MIIQMIGAGMVLMGAWAACFAPRMHWRTSEEKYRGAALLLMYQRAATVTFVAMGIFLVSGGMLLLTMSFPFTALSIILAVIGGAGAFAAMGSDVVAAILGDRLKIDADLEAWREHCEQASPLRSDGMSVRC